MEIVQFIGWIVVVLLLLVVLIAIFTHAFQRRAVPNRYEWLKVLNHTEWKQTLQLRKEMEKIKKSEGIFLIMPLTILYSDLDDLEEEGLVISREGAQINNGGHILQMYEYRLTSKGTRRKVETDSTQKNKHDFQVQLT